MPRPHKKLKEVQWPGLCCIEAENSGQAALVNAQPVSARSKSEMQFSARPQGEVQFSARRFQDAPFTANSPNRTPHDIFDQVSEFESRLQSSVANIMEQQYQRLSVEVLDILRGSFHQSSDVFDAGMPADRLSTNSKIQPVPSLVIEPVKSSNGNGKAKGVTGRFTVTVQPFISTVQTNGTTNMKTTSTGMEPAVTQMESEKVDIKVEEDGGHSNAASRFVVNAGRESNHKRFRLWKEESVKTGWRASLREVLQGTAFGLLSSALIFSYAGLIGVETEMVAKDPDGNSLTIKLLHYVYSGVFAAELWIRFLAFGWATFSGGDGFWNKLDVCFLGSAVVEVIMESAAGSVSGANSVVRPVRILRVVRTVRLVRAFRQFHEFQKMAYALLSSMRTLTCSMALLMFVMFFFAVWLTQSAADLDAREEIQDLDLRYGGLMTTTYTLFLSVSGGISWDLCYMPLYHLNYLASAALILYISMTLFGVLNVITSIFVESVMRSMQHSRDLIVQEKEEEKKIAIQHVKEVFRHLDSDSSGHITTEELEHFLKEPSLRKYMEALDIEAEDTRLLFRLLDRDGSGIISSDEFCEGCLRLKGSAKSIDVHALIFSLKAFLDKWGDFTAYVDENFEELRKTNVTTSQKLTNVAASQKLSISHNRSHNHRGMCEKH